MRACNFAHGTWRNSTQSTVRVLLATYTTNSSPLLSTIVNGNSTTAVPYNKLTQLFKRKATIMITDPPYCILHRKRTYGDIRGNKSIRSSKLEDAPEVPKFQSLSEYRQFSEKWIKAALNHALADGSYMIIWTNTLGKSILVDTCKSLGYDLVGEYIWAKTTKVAESSKLPAKYRFFHPISTNESEVLLRVYESALVFAPTSMASNIPEGYIQKRALSVNQCSQSPSSELVLRDSLTWVVATSYHDMADTSPTSPSKSNATNPSERKTDTGVSTSIPHLHPCHKPLGSLLPLLSTWTLPGDLILDPFAGSGGILSATHFLNNATRRVHQQFQDKDGHLRHYAGIEILPDWAESSKMLAA